MLTLKGILDPQKLQKISIPFMNSYHQKGFLKVMVILFQRKQTKISNNFGIRLGPVSTQSFKDESLLKAVALPL